MCQSNDITGTGPTGQSGLALLGIYLNDHLAGATLGAELASRLAGAHRRSKESATLERLAIEIGEDRAALLDLMAALEVPVRKYKMALGWMAEKVGRIKPNGRVLSRSPLSSLEEVEMMRLGVEGKRACWKTLRLLADRDDRLDKARLANLLRRASEQADTLEELRVRGAEELTTAP
jgi:hypothetical protein